MVPIVGKIEQINVGWVDNSYVAFITAVTLARHKLLTRKTKVNSFVVEPGKLWNSLPDNSNSVYYAVGGFSDSEIEPVLAKRCKVTIIGKLYGKRFGLLTKPTKIGSVKLYPVSKERQHGLEYLSVLTNYFKLNSETRFFLKLADMRSEMLVVLAVTDSWVDAFKLLTSDEVVSTPDDVGKVLDYIKNTKNYEQVLKELTNSIKNSAVASGRSYVVLDLRNAGMSIKRAEVISKYLFRDKKTLFLITKNSSEEEYTVGIVLRKNPIKVRLNTVLEILNSTLVQDRGSLKILKCGISDWNDMVEKIDVVAKLLSLR
ncbi:MAG: hypothetical protein QXU26_01555 [Thermofilaceae archaeon]